MRVDYLFQTLSIFLVPVLGSKRDLFAFEDKSWITDDHFQTIIRLSFPISKCCNVFLNDTAGDLEALFAQFRSIYPYEYVLKRIDAECDGYFLLGSTDEQIMRFIKETRSLLWKTEILVIVNNISSNSSILDGSLYGHANVNIVSSSGIWKLSQNYLKPRIFTELNRYEEMALDYDHINFHGRELQVCSIYRPPMTYMHRTINKTIDGEQVEVYLMDNDLERDGVEMRLFLIMAETLNFTWSIKKPEGNYTYGSRVNETVWKGGMIQMLNENKADVAFAGIWVTYDQNQFVHLSEPWYKLYLHFLVPRPRRTTSFWALSRPFSIEIWFLFIFALITYSSYVYVRAWIDPKFPKCFRNYLTTLTHLIGCLLSSSVPRTMKNKLQTALWQTAGWLIISAYCSSLAARLARPEYESRIDTVQQFLAANLIWGKMGQTPPFNDYFDLTDPYSAQLPNRYVHLGNGTQAKEYIKRDNYAILGKIVATNFFPEDYISNSDLKNYRLMKESVGQFYAAFALQPWLLEPVNKIMLRLKESGITVWHLRDVIRRRDSYNLREVLVEHDGYDGNAQVLGLTPLGAGFCLLIAGSSVATFVLYLELKRTARSASIREVLRAIESKRRCIDKEGAR